MLWFSLLVLIPLAAVVVTASRGRVDRRSGTRSPTSRRRPRSGSPSAPRCSSRPSTSSWARSSPGCSCATSSSASGSLEVLIDIPFALPTIVAGLVLLSLYGPDSPLGVDIANTRPAVFLAFLFVTLPFVVRTVQPVLAELDREVEEAAASLGASRFTTFRRIVLPSLTPAIAAGAALSFARAVSEYGSLVLLSGNLPFQTEVTSVRILSSIENDNLGGAAAVATVLLVISFAVIVASTSSSGRWCAVADVDRARTRGRPPPARPASRPATRRPRSPATCSG